MRTSSLFSRAGFAAALLVLVSPAFAAGNRYDDRKRDTRFEAREDEDDEGSSRDEESAELAPEESSSAETAADTGAVETVEAAEPAPVPEVVAEPAEPLPPLPDPATVAVALGTGFDQGVAELTGAGAEFNVAVPELVARVTIPGTGELGLSGRIVVEAAEGEVAGDEMVRAACPEYLGEQRSVNLVFLIPESGLPVGRYRLEVLESAVSARTIAAKVFTTKPTPLPAADRLRIGLHETEFAPEELGCGEQSSRPARLFATLETFDPTTLRVTAQIVAEDVPGVPRERVMAWPNSEPFTELNPNLTRVTMGLAVPRMGLPVGRYRVEFREVQAPRRLVKSTVFTTREQPETERFDLADPENGGLLESVSGEEGAGLTWAWMALRPHNTKEWTSDDSQAAVRLPCDFVVSFFKREPAMVAAVEVTPGGTAPAVAKIEVWGSMVSPKDGFQKVAEKTFAENTGEPFTVPVANALMRFVKIRLVQAQGGESQLGLRSLRVREGAAAGYQPLRQRLPEVRDWRFQPRHAAQQGLFFLLASGVEFQRQNNCMGCHVQSQALMGLSVARKNEYVVSDAVERELAGFTRRCATPAGDIGRHPLTEEEISPDRTNTIFGALGLAYATPDAASAQVLPAAARWLAAGQDPEGILWPDSSHPPVTQGEILQTVHAMAVWAAASAGGDPALAEPVARALAWLREAPVSTTQDKVFKVLAFVRHGGPAEKKLARQLCQELLTEQRPNGAWRVDPAEEGGVDSPFATGQVLHALREAGYSPNQPSFRRGVQWLLLGQNEDASWQAGDTSSPFASTMWPVIALTGSFSSKADPARLNVTAAPRPQPPAPPPPAPVVVAPRTAPPTNIMLVFDCSFSMTEKIRKRTKFEVAKEVLREVINQLPADTKVGLRFYGHRHGSMTSESRTDTQLVVPLGPLDREKLIGAIAAAQAQGQTPLVLSTLQAAEDLKKAGGGILIVVTDGEESCGGRPRKAGPQLAALGVPLRLEVIGFALTGRRVVDEMTAFTAPTGGRFHTAADGLQLAAALKAAAEPAPVIVPPPPPPPPAPEPEDLPFEVFDAQGQSVAKSSTLGGEPPELAPGIYRVVLRDGAKTATLDNIKLAESQTLDLRYDPATGRLEYLQ